MRLHLEIDIPTKEQHMPGQESVFTLVFDYFVLTIVCGVRKQLVH